MSKALRVSLTTLALGGLVGSPAVFAQELTCDDIEFKARVTDNFPNAAESCLEVVERDGKLYAKFVAKVVSVRRSGRTRIAPGRSMSSSARARSYSRYAAASC